MLLLLVVGFWMVALGAIREKILKDVRSRHGCDKINAICCFNLCEDDNYVRESAV